MPPKKVRTTEPEYEDEASVEELDEESTKHNKALLDAILSLKTGNEAILNAIQNLGNQPSIVKNEIPVQSTQKVKKKIEENQEDLYDQDMQHDKPLYYQASGNVSSAKTLHEQSIYSHETILNPPVGSPGLSDKKGKLMLRNTFVNGNGNAALDAFARFRSGPSNNEKTLDFLKRMVKAYGRLPTMDRQSSEAANTIRFTLDAHVTQIAEDLKRDDNFYPIYRALELAVVYAEKQSLIYSQLASRLQDTIPKQ
ncbi:hypothetical protein GcM3_053016, partial [Golovinomyces cichoracearum]